MQACNDTEQVASMNGMDASSAQLDWFGVPVKAAEIPVWTSRMKMLARKVRLPGRTMLRPPRPSTLALSHATAAEPCSGRLAHPSLLCLRQ